jgi:hypothetical protein
LATKDRVTIELYVDDQGTVKIRNATVATQELGQAATKGSADSAAAADDFASSLVKQIGIYALVTAAAYKLEQVLVGAFKGGIQSVDDFKLTTIGVAATLTDLGQAGADSQKDYARNIAYSKDMYQALELEAAKHFASGKDMVQAWNILAQKGIVLRKEEIGDLGTIVDKIKLATQGQVQAIQISQELRAMLSGQARATDQLAMMVKDRYGAAWKDVIEQHRQAGDLIHWLAEEFKGLKLGMPDIVETLTSQKTTLDTLLNQVGRAGLAGAYADIVGILQEINGYLRDHREEIGGGIARGWLAVKDLAGGVYGFVREIANIANKGIVIPITFSIGGMAKFLSSGGQVEGGEYLAGGQDAGLGIPGIAPKKVYIPPQSDFGFGAMSPDIGEASLEFKLKQNQEFADQAARYKAETYSRYALDLGAAPTRKLGGEAKKGGGGGKGRDTTDTLENLILQLRQEEAKLTDGAFAGVDAWYEKIVAKVRKLAMDDQQLKDGMLAASELKAAKEQKISDDLNKKYLSATHQTSALQIAEDLKRIADVKGHVKEEDQAREIMYQHAVERSQKLSLAENQQQKTYYDSLASASILITDQVAWKEKSWELEKKISQAQLEQWFIGKDLTNSQKDNYRGLLAMTNAAKDYNQQRQKAVDLGTLEGWAIERAGEGLKREKNTIKDAMTGAEGFFTDALGQGIQGALSGQKKSFKEVGQTIVQSMALELNKKSFTKIWENIAKMLAPKPQSTLVGGTTGQGLSSIVEITKLQQEAAAGSVEAARKLNESAGQLTGSAGGLSGAAGDHTTAAGGLTFSGASLGLSAGGLMASAIGVMTGSKELMYAGMVLQTAALLLEIAAMADTFLPFHSGGMIAHSGLLVAHGGLNLDERLIKAQVGEGIIKRDTMAAYARQGISFDDLNNGRLPVLPLPVPMRGGDSGGNAGQIIQHHTTTHVMVVTQDGKVIGKQTKREIINLLQDKDVQREIRVRAH